jgi:hypothetical protein
MSLHDLGRSKELKALKLSREEIAKRAIEIAEQIIKDGSYKNAVACIGRMHTLSIAISDHYWDEKRCYGKELEYYWLVHKSEEDKVRGVN